MRSSRILALIFPRCHPDSDAVLRPGRRGTTPRNPRTRRGRDTRFGPSHAHRSEPSGGWQRGADRRNRRLERHRAMREHLQDPLFPRLRGNESRVSDDRGARTVLDHQRYVHHRFPLATSDGAEGRSHRRGRNRQCGVRGPGSGVSNSPTETALSINADFSGRVAPWSDSPAYPGPPSWRPRQFQRVGAGRHVPPSARSPEHSARGSEPRPGDEPRQFRAEQSNVHLPSCSGCSDAIGSFPRRSGWTPGATIAVDILDTLGISSGLGSLDVYTNGEYAPVVVARVYNDTGNGTNGLNETMIPSVPQHSRAIFPRSPFPAT